MRRDAARTFVIADAGVVIGHYALVAGELDHGQATPQTRPGMSRHYPIPVGRSSRRSPSTAAISIEAWARPCSERFYQHFGFRSLSATPRTLMVTLAELRAAGYP